MESVSKRCRIQSAAMQLFQEQGVEATSVNEIVKKANVAKGTFYVYYKDKKELISQILTKQHGCLMNDLMEQSFALAQAQNRSWVVCFVEEMVSYYETHHDVLRMIQRNIFNVMDTADNRNLVLDEITRLNDFLTLLLHKDETRQDALNRFLMVMQMTGFFCFNAIFYDLPDSMEQIRPLLMNTVLKICE